MKTIPPDVKMECVYICKGHERRKRLRIRGLYVSSADKARLTAVEAAEAQLPDYLRGVLFRSLVDGTPYEHINVPIGRSGFYEKRREFLSSVARSLGYDFR